MYSYSDSWFKGSLNKLRFKKIIIMQYWHLFPVLPLKILETVYWSSSDYHELTCVCICIQTRHIHTHITPTPHPHHTHTTLTHTRIVMIFFVNRVLSYWKYIWDNGTFPFFLNPLRFFANAHSQGRIKRLSLYKNAFHNIYVYHWWKTPPFSQALNT